MLEQCKPYSIHFAIETSGFGDKEIFIELARKLDLIFFDIKHMSAEAHRAITGVTNELILDNMRSIQRYANEIIVRTPIVPGYNDSIENLKATAELCRELETVTACGRCCPKIKTGYILVCGLWGLL